MSRNLKNQLQGHPKLSPERRNDLPRGPKTSPGAPPTLLRDTKTLPTAPGDLPDAPRSAPSGAQPSLPGPPGSSPAFKKPMFSLRKTNNSQLSAPSRGSPAQDPDLSANEHPYYPFFEQEHCAGDIQHSDIRLISPTTPSQHRSFAHAIARTLGLFRARIFIKPDR